MIGGRTPRQRAGVAPTAPLAGYGPRAWIGRKARGGFRSPIDRGRRFAARVLVIAGVAGWAIAHGADRMRGAAFGGWIGGGIHPAIIYARVEKAQAKLCCVLSTLNTC
jgi:hypothetical protein